MLNALTIDVEDYFHTEAMSEAVSRDAWKDAPSRVQANTELLFETLASYKVKATLFFLGWVAEQFPGLVRAAVAQGHELACHSYWHRAVFRLTPDEFREDTKRAQQAIENAGGVAVTGYRAPSFSMTQGTEWAQEILAELGFTYDSSVNPIHHDFYGNPNAPRVPYRIANGSLLELPIATVRMGNTNFPMGGGAYLRILPLRYSIWGLRRINNTERQAAMFYLHPWEIDDGQPRLPVKMKSRIRQYTGLAGTHDKLKKLLDQFQFSTVAEVYSRELASIASTAKAN